LTVIIPIYVITETGRAP